MKHSSGKTKINLPRELKIFVGLLLTIGLGILLFDSNKQDKVEALTLEKAKVSVLPTPAPTPPAVLFKVSAKIFDGNQFGNVLQRFPADPDTDSALIFNSGYSLNVSEMYRTANVTGAATAGDNEGSISGNFNSRIELLQIEPGDEVSGSHITNQMLFEIYILGSPGTKYSLNGNISGSMSAISTAGTNSNCDANIIEVGVRHFEEPNERNYNYSTTVATGVAKTCGYAFPEFPDARYCKIYSNPMGSGASGHVGGGFGTGKKDFNARADAKYSFKARIRNQPPKTKAIVELDDGSSPSSNIKASPSSINDFLLSGTACDPDNTEDSCSSPQGQGIVKYKWEIREPGGQEHIFDNLQSPIRNYPPTISGNYNFTLTATDDEGVFSSESKTAYWSSSIAVIPSSINCGKSIATYKEGNYPRQRVTIINTGTANINGNVEQSVQPIQGAPRNPFKVFLSVNPLFVLSPRQTFEFDVGCNLGPNVFLPGMNEQPLEEIFFTGESFINSDALNNPRVQMNWSSTIKAPEPIDFDKIRAGDRLIDYVCRLFGSGAEICINRSNLIVTQISWQSSSKYKTDLRDGKIKEGFKHLSGGIPGCSGDELRKPFPFIGCIPTSRYELITESVNGPEKEWHGDGDFILSPGYFVGETAYGFDGHGPHGVVPPYVESSFSFQQVYFWCVDWLPPNQNIIGAPRCKEISSGKSKFVLSRAMQHLSNRPWEQLITVEGIGPKTYQY